MYHRSLFIAYPFNLEWYDNTGMMLSPTVHYNVVGSFERRCICAFLVNKHLSHHLYNQRNSGYNLDMDRIVYLFIIMFFPPF